jgi:hypothetical protein
MWTVPSVPRLLAGVAVWTAVFVALFLVMREVRDDDDRAATAPTTEAPSPPAFVDVTLDPAGRPYDVALPVGATVRHRPLAVLHAPSRNVIFLGGEAVPYVTAGEYEPVTLADQPGRAYPVRAIWMDHPAGDGIVGVVIVERDARIVRWRQLERVAYGTDGGLGGITTVEWAAKDKSFDSDVQRRWEEELVDKGRQSFVIDADGVEGIDTIAFSNGFGDGGFPSIAGYDARGKRSAIVLWTIAAPWRLAFPEGRPPPQVTARETALAACLEGRRKVYGARCRVAR